MDTVVALTIYAAGPIEDLARALAPVARIVHVTKAESFWEAGADLVLSQEAAKVEAFVDPDKMPKALDRLHGWLQESGESTIHVEFRWATAGEVESD